MSIRTMFAHKSIAVILASGTGARFRSATPKQFLKLSGKTVLEHTLDIFERHPNIDEIIIVGAAEHLLLTEQIATQGGYKKISKIIAGGATRRESSGAGIATIVGDEHKVLVHDAVRPLLDFATIDRCLEALDHCDAVDTGIPASDTIIRVSPKRMITEIPDRSALQLGQTPQGFRSGLLREAHRRASSDSALVVTDDCGLIVHYEMSDVLVVDGNVDNIKITYPSDIYLADRLFQLRARQVISASGIDHSLTGKVIVVFGGSRGIGERVKSIALEKGAHVLAVSRRDGIDITDAKAVRSTLKTAHTKYGHIDHVVNTAGILRTGLLSGQSYDIIDEQLTINLRGSLVVAKESFEAMRDSGGSIALFTSSSYTRGRARYSVYSATKAAIVNLVQALSEEFMPFNVRINAINPERTATPMRTENFGIEPEEQLLTADAVALATLGICSSPATGEVIDVRL